ncbi:MAG: TraR/DksA C4-type zinc finger protein [Chloroflexi bacterium]|nr:TraR/DksA C4-type zinc finger protein [Chloroflexota bacterium]
MPKKEESYKSVRRTIAGHVAVVARKAKKSAKTVLVSETPLPPPVEIEPRPLESPMVRALKRERARLLHDLKHQTLLAQDRPATGNHMADDASEVEAQTKALALRRHLEGMLQEIERAIARAEKGTYGICERCKQPISDERLKVMPSATLCITCAKLQTNHHLMKAAA